MVIVVGTVLCIEQGEHDARPGAVAAKVHGTQTEQKRKVIRPAKCGGTPYCDHLAARIGENTRHEAHVLFRYEAELRATLLDAGPQDDVLILVISHPAAVGLGYHSLCRIGLCREGRLAGRCLAVRLRLGTIVASCIVLCALLSLPGSQGVLGSGSGIRRVTAIGLLGLLLVGLRVLCVRFALAIAVTAPRHLARRERERAFGQGNGRSYRTGTREVVFLHRLFGMRRALRRQNGARGALLLHRLLSKRGRSCRPVG